MASTPAQSWQQSCVQRLTEAIALGGAPGFVHWESFRDTARQRGHRIVIADANFDQQGLAGLDLSRCWIGRTSFVSANLSNVYFVQSIFRDCNATNANIEGANFRNADMTGDGLKLRTDRYDAMTNFDVASDKMPDDVEPGLLIAAGVARRTRRLQHYRSHSMIARFLFWLTNYGFALDRLAIGGGVIVAAFALCFLALGQPPLDALMGSVKYFVSVNDSFSASALISAIGSLEALIGILFFAVFTAILLSLFIERN